MYSEKIQEGVNTCIREKKLTYIVEIKSIKSGEILKYICDKKEERDEIYMNFKDNGKYELKKYMHMLVKI